VCIVAALAYRLQTGDTAIRASAAGLRRPRHTQEAAFVPGLSLAELILKLHNDEFTTVNWDNLRSTHQKIDQPVQSVPANHEPSLHDILQYWRIHGINKKVNYVTVISNKNLKIASIIIALLIWTAIN
jgi:hypothetical protein